MLTTTVYFLFSYFVSSLLRTRRSTYILVLKHVKLKDKTFMFLYEKIKVNFFLFFFTF
jgi:hypothetical protein